MKFVLIDRIVELDPGRRIVTEKALSLAEEYLADHFPAFPVLPGVLMIEALVQSAAWIVRQQLDFHPSLILLKEARNVTYKSFLRPGRVMRLEVDVKEMGGESSTFQGRGTVGDSEIVKGRFTLRHVCLGDNNPHLKQSDERIRDQMRALFANLRYRNAG